MKKLYLLLLLAAIASCKKYKCQYEPTFCWSKVTAVWNGSYLLDHKDTVCSLTDRQVEKFIKDSTIFTEKYRRVYIFTKL